MPPSRQHGLTLIEVLVALVIIALALTAIIKVTAENIRGNNHLREKTLATWVGLNTLNKARLALIHFPDEPNSQEGSELALNQAWQWQGWAEKTANPRIRKLRVKVFHLPEHHLVTELTSYTYAA